MLVPRNSLVPASSDVGLDRLIHDLFDGFPLAATTWEPGQTRFPAVNTWEDEKSFHVEAELPGLSEKDVEISVLGNELKISGSREEKKEDDSTMHRRERYFGKFSRIVRFPVDIDAEKVEATFKNGVLEITLPKAAASLPRRIEVKTS